MTFESERGEIDRVDGVNPEHTILVVCEGHLDWRTVDPEKGLLHLPHIEALGEWLVEDRSEHEPAQVQTNQR